MLASSNSFAEATRADPACAEGQATLGLARLILSDIRRKQEHYVLVDRFFNKYVKLFAQHGTVAVLMYRVGHWAVTRPRRVRRVLATLLYRVMETPITWVSGISINPFVPIGPGFVIHNFSCVHVDAERIGENFTINQGVTVGPDWHLAKRPVIGDNVFVGSGAAVLGGIEVGNNVVIAANSLVSRSVASNCLVAGVPGLVIMRDLPDDYLHQVAPHERSVDASQKGTGKADGPSVQG